MTVAAPEIATRAGLALDLAHGLTHIDAPVVIHAGLAQLRANLSLKRVGRFTTGEALDL